MDEGSTQISEEVKKRYQIKDLVIPVTKLQTHGNLTSITISEQFEELPSDPNKNKVRTVRKRMFSRVLKGNRMTKGRIKRLAGMRKQRKSDQLMNEAVNDESTTNSENSEGVNLYNEINWEENLDCDTSALVDEFAPRVGSSMSSFNLKQLAPSSHTVHTPSLESKPAEIKAPVETKIPLQSKSYEIVPIEGQAFSTGLEIFVNDYNTSEWKEGTVVEVDWDDNEVLVHYGEGMQPDEWLSMNSQRISRTRPTIVNSQESNEVILPLPTVQMENEKQLIPEIQPSKPVGKIAVDKEPQVEEGRPFSTAKEFIKKFGPRGWKKNKPIPLPAISRPRFSKGEIVLAKWSDHRMQKFPALIKTVLGDGRYDVLFYDGFEKTMMDVDLFKTTEEEVAKYNKTNPSEADIFVDMEADSKEARRHRKKKTFDDYVFAKDLYITKKSRFKDSEGFAIKNKLSYYNKGRDDKDVVKPSLQSLHSGRKRGTRRKGFRGRRGRRTFESKLLVSDAPQNSASSTSYELTESNQMFTGFTTGNVEESHRKIIEHNSISDERWLADVPQDISPITIHESDGMKKKSLLVPDKNLPPGWSKHAVLQPGNIWDIILLSPDGCRFKNDEELKKYYTQLSVGGEPPSSLDFQVNLSLLPDFSTVRKERLLPATPKIWFHRSTVRGGRRGRGRPASRSVGRVRTLMPKHRTELLEHSLPTPPLPESEEWRCPKEECDKKFRKENLLQMHIKHYHSELHALVQKAPNVVDLACARSVSANSDWSPMDSPKVPHHGVKRILPRPFSPNNTVSETDLQTSDQQGASAQFQSGQRLLEKSLGEMSLKRQNAVEEKRTTIKTMLPLRQTDSHMKGSIDSDGPESEEDCIEQKKNGSRIFKPGRFRKGKFLQGSVDEHHGYLQSPSFKLTKKKISALDKLQITTDSNDSYTEEEKTSPNTEVTDEGIAIERLRSEEVINCTCGYREEDGLMIQCDICMCWQHGLCCGIDTEADVPDRYICNICRNPLRVRSSKKYDYAQQYLTQGKLPSFSFRTRNEEELNQREMTMKRCYELSAALREVKNFERCIAAKINIAEQKDHPKLYLWAKNWDQPGRDFKTKEENDNQGMSRVHTGPEPEAPIDLEDCRLRLLDHIEKCYSEVDDRLTSIQTQIAELESQDADHSGNPITDKVTKETIQMLIRDFNTIQKIAAIS